MEGNQRHVTMIRKGLEFIPYEDEKKALWILNLDQRRLQDTMTTVSKYLKGDHMGLS